MEHAPLTCGYYAYWADIPTDGVEFYVRDGRDILVFPTHDGLTCVRCLVFPPCAQGRAAKIPCRSAYGALSRWHSLPGA